MYVIQTIEQSLIQSCLNDLVIEKPESYTAQQLIDKLNDHFKTYLRFRIEVKACEVNDHRPESTEKLCATYKDSYKNNHTVYFHI